MGFFGKIKEFFFKNWIPILIFLILAVLIGIFIFFKRKRKVYDDTIKLFYYSRPIVASRVNMNPMFN